MVAREPCATIPSHGSLHTCPARLIKRPANLGVENETSGSKCHVEQGGSIYSAGMRETLDPCTSGDQMAITEDPPSHKP